MGTSPAVLLYGATGFSGRSLAAELSGLADGALLAGRSAERVEPLAHALGQPWAAFPPDRLREAVSAFPGLRMVVNAAGPFEATALPLMEGCMALGLDYLDIAGEWPVFASALGLSDAAQAAGVMLLPGAAFSVAASDCLLLKASRLMRDVQRLRIAFSRPRALSRGSAASTLALSGPEARTTEDGRLVAHRLGSLNRSFDFGQGLRMATALSWPDIVTAPLSTGVTSIETYSETAPMVRLSLAAQASMWPVIEAVRIPSLIKGAVAAVPRSTMLPDPGEKGMVLVAEAEDRWRRTATIRMRTADGYSATTLITSAAVQRVLAGVRRPGFTTPAQLFGAEFMEEIGAGRLDCAAADGERA